ncbi:hypothetical protein [Streptomyces sp. NPDC055287]
MTVTVSRCDDVDEELALFPAPPPVQYQDPDQHVIQFSGGVGSALAALTLVERVGPSAMTLLIANTQVEDPVIYSSHGPSGT